MRAIGIIPARYDSTRFPGKPLVNILGKPMLQYVWQRALEVRSLARVIIATDDERIMKRAREFGAEVMLTSASHKSGTERVAAAAKELDAEIIANIQGDEPLIKAAAIDGVIKALASEPEVLVGTLACKISNEDEMHNPGIVKVVFNKDNFALYFSRSPIPYLEPRPPHRRRGLAPLGQTNSSPKGAPRTYKHLGLYVYRKSFLLKLARMRPTPLEKIEVLEQLRVLENGYRIKVLETEYDSIGVDTPEDLEKVKAILQGSQIVHQSDSGTVGK